MQQDIDPIETGEWIEALDDVLKHAGEERTAFLLKAMVEHAAQTGTQVPAATTTPFINMMLGNHFFIRKKSCENFFCTCQCLLIFKKRNNWHGAVHSIL